ncbi:MAG: hypothetical protein LUD07_02655 [Clostridiales bacterium]|nr:hypothetical protein [Clostridiales bacterium]
MGKVQYIKKSRKEYTCGKCRQSIPVGSPYYRGILNFHQPIIRCVSCGLKSYEVTKFAADSRIMEQKDTIPSWIR